MGGQTWRYKGIVLIWGGAKQGKNRHQITLVAPVAQTTSAWRVRGATRHAHPEHVGAARPVNCPTLSYFKMRPPHGGRGGGGQERRASNQTKTSTPSHARTGRRTHVSRHLLGENRLCYTHTPWLTRRTMAGVLLWCPTAPWAHGGVGGTCSRACVREKFREGGAGLSEPALDRRDERAGRGVNGRVAEDGAGRGVTAG